MIPEAHSQLGALYAPIVSSQLVALMGDGMQLLVPGALLEEVHHRGWALRVHSAIPLPVHCLCFPISEKCRQPASLSCV